jgi:hypothetical protein
MFFPADAARRHRPATSTLIGAIGALLPAVAAHAETTPAPGDVGASVTAAAATAPTADEKAIRPFRFHATDEALADLRRRIAATQWPEQETMTDSSQGVPLATMRRLARYWASDDDWRKAEAKLNALPQFVTNIDGLDIHFIHVRSPHNNALPMIITHGWPAPCSSRSSSSCR